MLHANIPSADQPIQVGELWNKNHKSYREGTIFQYDANGGCLICFMNRLSEKEITAFRKNKVELRLLECQPIIFLLYKINGYCDWSDSSYTYHLVQSEIKPSIRYTEKGQGMMFNMFLVEATTGIVKAMRVLGTSAKFNNYFIYYLQNQIDRPFDIKEYDTKLDNIYNTFTSKELAIRSDIYYKSGSLE